MIVQIDGNKFLKLIDEKENENRQVYHNDDWNVGLDQALYIFWSMISEGEGKE